MICKSSGGIPMALKTFKMNKNKKVTRFENKKDSKKKKKKQIL
jgi:hypothetical protein